MTYPVKNSTSASRQPDPQETEGYGYDPNLGGLEDIELGDEFISEDGTESGDEAPPMTVTDLRKEIKGVTDELTHNKDLPPAERRKLIRELNALKGQVSAAMALKGDSRTAKLAQIEQDLVDIENQMAGDPEVESFEGEEELAEPTMDLKQLEKDLRAAIDDIDGRVNLTEDEKIELKAPLEKQLTELKLAEKDPSQIDPDQIQADLEETKQNADEMDAYSPALKGLSQACDLEPEVIKGKAEAKGIDFNNLTLPPSIALLNFLTELSPEILDAFKKVETTMSDRIKTIQDNAKAMGDIAAANCNKDTSAACITEVGPWQNLFNLKHFQDDKSQAVASAMGSLVQTLIPIFKALFPDQEVKAVEDQSPAGWQKTEGEYKVADKIQIGGMTIDLINNTTGKMQNSTSADADVAITFNDLWYDGEGSGEWHPPSLQTYGEAQPAQRDNE